MTERNSGGTTINQATYTYDALDRRISLNDNGTWIWTVYDGHNPYADFTGAGSLAMRYLDGGAIDQIFARTNSAGVTAWYLDDHLGSVRDLVSISSGGYTVLDHVDYDPFGNIIQETSPSNGDRYKYAGMEYDPVTGQYYDRARYYNAVTGRFDSQDPSGFGGEDVNLYRYVSNEPSIYFDGTGRQQEEAGDDEKPIPPPKPIHRPIDVPPGTPSGPGGVQMKQPSLQEQKTYAQEMADLSKHQEENAARRLARARDQITRLNAKEKAWYDAFKIQIEANMRTGMVDAKLVYEQSISTVIKQMTSLALDLVRRNEMMSEAKRVARLLEQERDLADETEYYSRRERDWLSEKERLIQQQNPSPSSGGSSPKQ